MVSKMVTVNINTDNDAFKRGRKRLEVARIMRVIAARVKNGETSGNCQDINGNTCGTWTLNALQDQS